jgi:hypothetical protein
MSKPARAAAGGGEVMGEKLTKAQREALRFILAKGPGTLPLTKAGRTPAAVADLVEAGLLETLNRIRPSPPMYEITPAGRAALSTQDGASVWKGRIDE